MLAGWASLLLVAIAGGSIVAALIAAFKGDDT
jgi:hypothetical protein